MGRSRSWDQTAYSCLGDEHNRILKVKHLLKAASTRWALSCSTTVGYLRQPARLGFYWAAQLPSVRPRGSWVVGGSWSLVLVAPRLAVRCFVLPAAQVLAERDSLSGYPFATTWCSSE